MMGEHENKFGQCVSVLCSMYEWMELWRMDESANTRENVGGRDIRVRKNLGGSGPRHDKYRRHASFEPHTLISEQPITNHYGFAGRHSQPIEKSSRHVDARFPHNRLSLSAGTCFDGSEHRGTIGQAPVGGGAVGIRICCDNDSTCPNGPVRT